MEKTLKQKTVHGFAWSGLDKLLQQILIFICGIYLARRLSDTDYGLVGVLAIFTYMANALQESGFGIALVRKKDVTEDDYNTVFFFNIIIGLSLYIVLFFSAPFISRFYNEPLLTDLSRFIFLSFVFSSFSVVQSAQVLKTINYKLLAKVNILSIIVSYAIALWMAYSGFGPWSIATQLVVLSAGRCIFLWIFNRWTPRFIFSKKSFKDLFSFGSNILFSNILNTITTNIIPSIIGKYYTIQQTGYYYQANKLFNSASDMLTGSVLSVAFPVLSSIDEENRLKKIFRKFVRMSAFLIFPFFMGIILVAHSFIFCFLGEKWMQSIPILQILCFGGIFYALNTANGQIQRLKGKSILVLKFETIRNILIIAVVVFSVFVKIDYLYMIACLAVVSLINYVIQTIISIPLINYKPMELMRDICPYFCIAVFSVSLGWTLKFLIQTQLVLFIVRIFWVAGIYIGITYFSGSMIMKELISLIKNRISK